MANLYKDQNYIYWNLIDNHLECTLECQNHHSSHTISTHLVQSDIQQSKVLSLSICNKSSTDHVTDG